MTIWVTLQKLVDLTGSQFSYLYIEASKVVSNSYGFYANQKVTMQVKCTANYKEVCQYNMAS